MRRPTQSTVLPILILVAAVSIWAFDTYRQASPARPEAKTTEPTATFSPPSKTGGYETFQSCTLAPDRGNDGDSFRVKLPNGRTEIIRLYFVDAPESAFKSYAGGANNHRRIDQQAADMGGISPQQAVEIGKKAKAFTLNTLGKSAFTIHTKWDSPFNDDRYHAFVKVSVGGKPRFLHQLLIENGLARIHTKGAALPDGTSERNQESLLHNLERAAKATGTGAWGL